jgi:hypothetical protein
LAIDSTQKDTFEDIEVGAIIVATGFGVFLPERKQHSSVVASFIDIHPDQSDESTKRKNASTLSDVRSREGVKGSRDLRARSIKSFEGGRWRLRRMRANGKQSI